MPVVQQRRGGAPITAPALTKLCAPGRDPFPRGEQGCCLASCIRARCRESPPGTKGVPPGSCPIVGELHSKGCRAGDRPCMRPPASEGGFLSMSSHRHPRTRAWGMVCRQESTPPEGTPGACPQDTQTQVLAQPWKLTAPTLKSSQFPGYTAGRAARFKPGQARSRGIPVRAPAAWHLLPTRAPVSG